MNDANRSRMARITGSCRTYRLPDRNAGTNRSRWGTLIVGRRQISKMISNTAPVATFTANTGGTPQVAMTNPAIAGPAARDTFTLTMSSRVAAANSARGTSSVIRDCQVGDSIACPAPTANVNDNSSAGGILPTAVSTASNADTTMKYPWITTSIHRRSNASASTPAGSANNIIGSVLAVCTSGTIV